MFAPLTEAPQAKKSTSGPARRPLSATPEVLSRPGEALSPATQASVGRALDFTFSDVRIHNDSAAHASAAELGARGWTLGQHVVLGASAGPDTLIHELAHVVQQNHAPREDALQVGEAGDALEQEAALAARTLRPPTLRAPSQQIQMQHEGEANQFQLREPTLGRPANPHSAFAPGHLEFHLTPEDQHSIDGYLLLHGFGLMRMRPALDGSIVTVDEIVDRVRPLVLTLIGRDQIEAYISGKVHTMVLNVLLHPQLSGDVPPIPTEFILPLPPQTQPPAAHEARPIQGWQTVLAAGGQIAWHVGLATGRPASTPQDVTMQFQAARNFVGHPDRESGSELQGQIQFGYNITTGQVTVLSGAQYTETFSLFNGLLQLQGFAQLLAGIAAGGGSVSAQIQPSVGLQAVVQVGPLQVGAQVFRGVTLSPGGESTQDTGGGLSVQYSF